MVRLSSGLLCGWLVFGLGSQAFASDLHEELERKWNQIIQWVDGFESTRKPAGRLLDSARAMKQEQLDELVYQISKQRSELLPRVDPDKLPEEAIIALRDLVAWHQVRGGLGEKRCKDFGDVGVITLLNLGKLALATASSRGGDKRAAAVLRLAHQLRRGGGFVHTMVGLSLNEEATLLLKNGDLAYGPEWERFGPKADELFFAIAREAICFHEMFREEVRSTSDKIIVAWLLGFAFDAARSRKIDMLMHIYPLRSDLEALARYFKKVPEQGGLLGLDFISPRIYLMLIEKYKKGLAMYSQALTQVKNRKRPPPKKDRITREVIVSEEFQEALEPVDAPIVAKEIGPNKRQINRKALDSFIQKKTDRIALHARIVPAFENGKAIGFKIFKIRPNSIYDQLGIKNNDIILTVAGYPINNPDKAIEVYKKLGKMKASSKLNVELLRRGKKIQFTFQLE